MLIGLIKWFDPSKGYGVIGTPNEGDFFLRINSFESTPKVLSIGTPIIFTPDIDKVKNRNYAKKSRYIGKPEDWKTIIDYLDKSNYVKIEVEITGRGRAGNQYRRKEIESFSLIDIALKHFLTSKSEDEILKTIIAYFDYDLEAKNFILYCEKIEERIKKHYPKDIANNILLNSYSYFRNKLDEEILFEVWKHKKFKFITYLDKDDYEISENILKSNMHLMGPPELKRILGYSFGQDFCSQFVDFKFKDIDHYKTSQFKDLYQYLEFESENERHKRKSILNDIYAQRITIEVIDKANELGEIKDNDDLHDYKRLFQHIAIQLDDENKSKISEIINKNIGLKSSDEFKPELWLQSIIEEPPIELISKIFINIDTITGKRISILSKLKTSYQIELLKTYSIEYGYESAFILLEDFLIKENSLGYFFKLSTVLFDTIFWKDKKGYELIILFNEYINVEISEENRLPLFLKGYLKEIPLVIIYQNINLLEKKDFQRIFEMKYENNAYIKEILLRKVETRIPNNINWIYELADEFLDINNFNILDRFVFETTEGSEYLDFWQKGKAKIFPQKAIEEILKDNFEIYLQINNWINNNSTTKEKIEDFLFSNLIKQPPIKDRIVFYTIINHIKYLLQLDEQNLEKIININNPLYNPIIWHLDKGSDFDFEQIKGKFIYFAPDDQVRIIRKLFYLKVIGTFDFTIEKLDELTRFDLDLYNTNLNFKTEVPIDISTDVVIKALLSFHQNQNFFVESELLTIILNDLKLDKAKQFRLSNYFENCLGRQTATYNWSTEGEIKKVNYGNNQFYFAISFSPGETIWVRNPWGGKEIYSPNPNFQKIKAAVKNITAVKWNPNEKHWGVLSQYEHEVLQFAKDQRFFIDIEGSNYKNNTHLAEFSREQTPNGITFCEGRLAAKEDELFKKEFWWCGGQKCFSKCETIHTSKEWEEYTLLDFCEILGFNTDETNKMGDHISHGKYYQFIALTNRFNRLLDKLYCHDCKHILYPSTFGTSHFAAHTLVRFQCRNEECSNNDEIYLNHCLNGQCNCIIDSRVSDKCNNGLFICDNCGSCCSHNMLDRRLTNLKLNGGHIHENLEKCVNEKLGHLERGEYFCYKCKEGMAEISHDIFQCTNCNVEYDTTKYKLKRPHKYLTENKTTIEKNNSI